VEVYLHSFLTPAQTGGEWSASCFGYFIPGESAPGIPQIRVWVGPGASLDILGEEKSPLSLLGFEFQNIQPVV